MYPLHPIDFLPYHFFVWCGHTAIGLWVKETTWVFPIIETIHLMCLSIVLGTTIMVDLRLLGLGLHRSPTAQVARELEPWMLGALGMTVLTGAFLFMSESIRLSVSGPFFVKMMFFALALLVHFTIHWKATAPSTSDGAWFGKVAACLSLMCWFGVALSGRAIAFL